MGRVRRGEPARARTSSSSGWADGQGGQRLDVAPPARRDGRRRRRQVLLRRPGPLPWAFAYAPRGPVLERWDAAGDRRGSPSSPASGLRSATSGAGRVSHLRIDPEIERGAGPDEGGAVTGGARGRRLAAGRRRSSRSRPASIDLAADEDALWGDLRKKWRQYVNKARTGGVRVVDAGPERLDEFYRIYRETADRAGFLIRAQSAYRDVWDAFGPGGHARLLFAELRRRRRRSRRCSSSAPGARVVEPYGGMTQAGADSRANYLLKWEAIRSSREQGATTLRPVGPRPRRDRPLQDRLRRPRDRATSGRATSCSTRSGGGRTRSPSPRGCGSRGCATGCAAAGRPRATRGDGVRRRRRGPADRSRHGRRRGRRVTGGVVELDEGALGDWDARAVDAPGGHVRQSRAWAAHRGSQGWRPRFLAIGDNNQNLSQDKADVLALSAQIAGLPPTQTFGDILNTATITSTAQLNVISVNSINLTKKNLTLVGNNSGTDVFLINVKSPTALFALNNSKVLLSGGLTANRVLFNFPGTEEASIFTRPQPCR